MDLKRVEIMPGVCLNYIRSDKFKTASMSIHLLTQLQRDTASINALIPFVLIRGTLRYPTMDAVSARLEELYGTGIVPSVRKVGEIQCIGFCASFPEDVFLPAGDRVSEEVCNMLASLLLAPATKGGLLIKDYVESEKNNMIDIIRSAINNKRGYAVKRCIEEMCCFEDYSAGRLGDEISAENIDYRKLTRQYHLLLSSSPIEITYCGRADFNELKQTLKFAFSPLPRGEIDYEIGTDVRMNSVEDEPRFKEESFDVSQAVLVEGYRLGECMDDNDFAAMYVFSSLLGGSPTSLLFSVVREKMSLCYYIGSSVHVHKGILLITAGIDRNNVSVVREQISAQIDIIKNGTFSTEQFESAKANIVSGLRSTADNPSEIESYFFSRIISGMDIGPDVMAELVSDVTENRVMAIAQSLECDQIYLLSPEEEPDE